MATQIRKTSPGLGVALVNAVNAMRRLLASTSGVVHGDVTSTTLGDFLGSMTRPATVLAAPASDLPSLLVLCAEIAARHAQHVRDPLAHESADAVNALSRGAPTDLASAIAMLNEAKAKWSLHLAQPGVHFTNDTANAITAADATDLASAITLANTYRAVHAAHIQNALFGASIDLLEA